MAIRKTVVAGFLMLVIPHVGLNSKDKAPWVAYRCLANLDNGGIGVLIHFGEQN